MSSSLPWTARLTAGTSRKGQAGVLMSQYSFMRGCGLLLGVNWHFPPALRGPAMLRREWEFRASRHPWCNENVQGRRHQEPNHKPPSSCFGALPLPHYPSLWLGGSSPKARWHQQMVRRQACVSQLASQSSPWNFSRDPSGTPQATTPLGLSSFRWRMRVKPTRRMEPREKKDI